MSWWVIYEHTCPYCAECSAVFDEKSHDPCAPPSIFNWSYPKWVFFVSPDEKVLKGKSFAHVRGETKNSRSTKRHQNQGIEKLLIVEKILILVLPKWSVLWRWLKFKHVRINTWVLVNKFSFWGSPLIFGASQHTYPLAQDYLRLSITLKHLAWVFLFTSSSLLFKSQLLQVCSANQLLGDRKQRIERITQTK